MRILDMHDANSLEATSTIEIDATQTWNAGNVYALNELVRHGDIIYKSAQSVNTNNEPSVAITAWLAVTTVNEKGIYDVYPDTLSVNTTVDIVLTYNVTNVDTVFIGNAKGNTVTIDLNGTVISKVLLDATVSPNQAWGLTDDAHGSGDLFLDAGALISGTLTVTVTMNAGEASVGYVLFGEATEVGCTLMQQAVKYEVRSGITSRGTVTGIDRAKKDSYVEITLPIYVDKTYTFSDILNTLAKYRGVPMLAIGDDTGTREELIFWGIYTDIDAFITEENKYNITITSLDSTTYVPATELEISEEAIEDEINPTDFIFWGFDSGTNTEILFDNSDITSYYNGLALATEMNSDMLANATINVNNLGSQPIFRNGVALTAGQLKQGKTYIMYYRNNRFNVATDIYYNYGNDAVINGLNLEYVDEDYNAVTKLLSELIDNTANDAVVANQVMTYTDDTDGVIVVLVEDLLNQPHGDEIDKSSRHYLRNAGNIVPSATRTIEGIVELATDAEIQTGTDLNRVITVSGLISRVATTLKTGLIQIATDAQALAGTSATLAITPASLLNYFNNRIATFTTLGTTEIATQAETDARTDAFRYITPLTLHESEAKTTQRGLIEIATCAEVEAGTDTERAVVPACLAQYVDVDAVTGVPVVSDFTNNCIVYDCTTGQGYYLDGGVVTEVAGGGGGLGSWGTTAVTLQTVSYTKTGNVSPEVMPSFTVLTGGICEITHGGVFHTSETATSVTRVNGVVVFTSTTIINTGVISRSSFTTLVAGDVVFTTVTLSGNIGGTGTMTGTYTFQGW